MSPRSPRPSHSTDDDPMRPCHLIALLIAAACTAGAVAQPQPGSLRQPSRTVYKCEAAGKVTYSDEPCAGAVRVEVEPTRGLNKSSGSERTGADVARERRREGIAEAHARRWAWM